MTAENLQPEQEFIFPQYPFAEQFEPFLYRAGMITHQSNVLGFQRPLALRSERATMLKQILNTSNREERKDVLNEAHINEALSFQFERNQHIVETDLGELGKQSAPYVLLTPPDEKDRNEALQKPPVILLPGVSNDLEGTGWLTQKLGRKRNVLSIAYPDAMSGRVTQEFGDAVKKEGFKPYTQFFGKTIDQLLDNEEIKKMIGQTSDLELWGFSTGGILTAKVLTDPAFQNRTYQAVIINPPGLVDRKNVLLSISQEYTGLLQRLNQISKMNPTNRTTIQKSEEEHRKQLNAHYALRERVLQRNEWWKEDIRIKNNGKIIVIISEKDTVTGGHQAIDELRAVPQFDVVEFGNGIHNTPLIQPEKIIDFVSARQRMNNRSTT